MQEAAQHVAAAIDRARAVELVGAHDALSVASQYREQHVLRDLRDLLRIGERLHEIPVA